MKKIIILYVFLLIVSISFVLSGSGLGYQGINITIFSPVNNSVHYTTSIDLNWTVNITQDWCAYSLDDGVNDSFSGEWCYQETANVSTACGGLDTGNYSCQGTWDAIQICENAFNENYNDYAEGDANDAILYINYTKPSNALSSSLWKVKDDSALVNISINSVCWEQSPLQLRVNSHLGDVTAYWSCFNGATWVVLRSTENFMKVYEEAMWWDISGIENITLTSLSEGSHNVTIYCNDTDGNMGQSYYSRWYNGNYTVSAPEGQSLDTSVLTLTISKDDDFISNINVTFTYNNTLQTSISNTSYTDYIIFNKTITNPDIDSDANVSYFWNVTINQSDGISYDFIISENQSVLPWGLDNCTLYSTHAINFSFKDETNSSTITSDITGTFTYSADQITYKTFNLDLDQVDNFSICIKPPGTTIFSSYELQYSATGYPSRRYNENNGVLTNATVLFPLYLLKSEDGLYGRFRVVDQYQVPLDDVTISMERTISGTERVIEQETTDSSGLATFWVDPDEEYDFTFTKTGYGSEEFTLRLTTSEIYTITLFSQVTEENESIYIGLRYRFEPSNTILNNNTNYNFSFTLNSSFTDITNCTLRLRNGSEILSQSSSYTSSSCGITIEYNTNDFTSILSEAIFEINHTSITVSQQYSVIYTYEGEFSLKSFLDDLSDFAMAGFNDFTRMIIALIVIFIITSLAAMNLGFTDTEKLIPLVVMLVWFFSYVNWFYLNFEPIPSIAGFDLKKYIIAILITLTGIAFLMDKFTR